MTNFQPMTVKQYDEGITIHIIDEKQYLGGRWTFLFGQLGHGTV